jgi:hypothetical protein
MGIEGEEIQTKYIYSLFNKIITENFYNLKKERVIQVVEVSRHQTVRPKEATPLQIYHNQNTQCSEQRMNTDSCKSEKKRHL